MVQPILSTQNIVYLFIIFANTILDINYRRLLTMEKNESIKCTIHNCKFNNEQENYCSLNQIKVGTHEANPKMVECTDCESFVLK